MIDYLNDNVGWGGAHDVHGFATWEYRVGNVYTNMAGCPATAYVTMMHVQFPSCLVFSVSAACSCQVLNSIEHTLLNYVNGHCLAQSDYVVHVSF